MIEDVYNVKAIEDILKLIVKSNCIDSPKKKKRSLIV